MSLTQSVEPPPTLAQSFDAFDVSRLFVPAFPDATMVRDAAKRLHPLPAWDGSEGPRYRLHVAPGVVAVRSRDLARAERTADRIAEARGRDHLMTNSPDLERGGYAAVFDAAEGIETSSPRRGVVSAWSRRSRSRMTERLLELDYAPLYDQTGTPAMLTNTYPDDWRSVVPDGATFKRHLLAYRKRFERAWDRPLVAVWKMEFQRRGAPHVHMLLVPPVERLDGETFREWNARVWVEIVGAASCGLPFAESFHGCCDRHAHLRVHLGPKVVDYGEGMRSSDPRRLGVYFAKHGSYSAKEYQNHAPSEWLHRSDCPDHGKRFRVLAVCSGCQSVGRFWGRWHLDVAKAEVEVSPAEAQAAIRTMRRYARANAGWKVREYVGTRLDTSTGELAPATGTKRVRYRRRLLTQRGGFLAVNSGPRFATQLADYLDQVGGRDVRSIYGHQIGAARNKERPATMTAAGRGLLVRAAYLSAEPLPSGLSADSENNPDLLPRPAVLPCPQDGPALFLA